MYYYTLIAFSSLMRDITSVSSENNKSLQRAAGLVWWHLVSYFEKGLGRAANFQLGSDHCVSHIITPSVDLHWPPPSTSRLSNWLTLPVRCEAASAWIHPHYKSLHGAYAQAHIHTHTDARARKHIFGSIHKRSESSVLCRNVLTKSMFPNTEDVSHFHQHQSVLIMFLWNVFSWDAAMSLNKSDVLVSYI